MVFERNSGVIGFADSYRVGVNYQKQWETKLNRQICNEEIE